MGFKILFVIQSNLIAKNYLGRSPDQPQIFIINLNIFIHLRSATKKKAVSFETASYVCIPCNDCYAKKGLTNAVTCSLVNGSSKASEASSAEMFFPLIPFI